MLKLKQREKTYLKQLVKTNLANELLKLQATHLLRVHKKTLNKNIKTLNTIYFLQELLKKF